MASVNRKHPIFPLKLNTRKLQQHKAQKYERVCVGHKSKVDIYYIYLSEI